MLCNDLTAVGCFDLGIQTKWLKIKSSPTRKLWVSSFDGDEGTVHAPQSKDAMLEVALLMSVKNCIMNAQNNKNIIGVVMDSLTGSYLLTQPETFVSRATFMNIVSFIENNSGRDTLYERLEKYNVPRTSGRALFSSILPEDFYYNKGDVLIRDGILVSGVITKDHIGSTHGSIIQVMMKDYADDQVTINFLTDIYNIVRQWLDVRGFSVGLDDCFLIGDNPEKSIQFEVERAKMLVKSMGWKLKDPLEEERREKQVIAYLNTAKGLGARISAENLAVTNAFNVMAKSGAKGSTFNIAQITGILGQQFVQGQRMPEAISDGTRCLPYFYQNSLEPASRGFCNHSFLEGLSPSELFFHQAGSREGLTDTAIKSVSGDTPIIIIENNKPKRVMIGDWIDNLLIDNKECIEYYPDDRDMELLKINNAKIPTTDLNGNVSWGDITAVTRHDPGDTLYRIKTIGGREVVVTKAHSLLIWNSLTEQFERRNTPTVNEGDYMPTTMKLEDPSTFTQYIDMSNYLPKEHYLYGTDFLIAADLVKDFGANNRSPAGWWKKNNGKTFTVPYTKTTSMLRTLSGRSNIDYIKNGCVYPYRGRRINTYIPDKLELNRKNGFFIGLYLAEGDADSTAGSVRIGNNDPEIHDAVKEWFELFNMNWEYSSKINKIGGTSMSIRGFSTVMAEFFIKSCGSGAECKKVPPESYTAPDEFIIGLLDGYISGDGHVGKNVVKSGSASKELIEGLCFLTTRLGIFAKMSSVKAKSNNLGTKNIKTSYTMVIRGQWARKFSEMISITMIEKQDKLNIIKPSEFHRNFPERNNVVLDKIVSIEKIDPKSDPKYKRVYDLTVPSTLNFGLANGLHVVDTADTGSMHHRVVKALEDVKVYEDGSARNAFGVIFQYTYGEDGFDASMMESVGTKTGKFASFINTKRLAGRINTKYGYKTPGEPDPEDIVPVPKFKVDDTGFPDVPTLKGIEIGDIVQYDAGKGVVQKVEGERILIQGEGNQPDWVKIEKLDM